MTWESRFREETGKGIGDKQLLVQRQWRSKTPASIRRTWECCCCATSNRRRCTSCENGNWGGVQVEGDVRSFAGPRGRKRRLQISIAGALLAQRRRQLCLGRRTSTGGVSRNELARTGGSELVGARSSHQFTPRESFYPMSAQCWWRVQVPLAVARTTIMF